MKTPRSQMRCFATPFLALFGLTLAVSVFGQNQTINGTLTVTGTTTLNSGVSVTGTVSATGQVSTTNNLFIAGTRTTTQAGTNYGLALQFLDDALPKIGSDAGANDSMTFIVNRYPGSWLWEHNVSTAAATASPAMRLDSGHNLQLYATGSTLASAPTISLTPSASSPGLALGTANLTASGTALTTNGALTVGGNITNTTGSLTGGATGLTLTAGGTNQNVTLTPSGTGNTILNGNVGIGTTAPLRKLQLGGDAFGLGFEFANISPNAGALRFGDNTGWKFHIGRSRDVSGGALDSGTAGALVTFQDNGNVGIGTTSPQTNLHIFSTAAYAPQNLLESVGNTGAGYLIFEKARAGNTAVQANDVLGTMLFNGYSNGTYQQSSYIAAVADTAPSGSNVYSALIFDSNHPGGGFAENLRIASSGNVGIGTATPLQKLQVWGTARFGADANGYVDMYNQPPEGAVINLRGNSGTNMFLENDNGLFRLVNSAWTAQLFSVDQNGNGGFAGNVGIGTFSPTSPLTVVNNNPNALVITGSSTNSVGLSLNNTATGGHNWTLFSSGGGGANAGAFGLYDNTAPGTRFVVDASGNVGIGTQNPLYRLEVSGGSKFYPVTGGDNAVLLNAYGQTTGQSGLAIGYNQTYNGTAMANSAYMQAESQGVSYRNLLLDPLGGNVGIGTTSPTQKLSVAGTIQAYAVVVNTGWSDYVFDKDYRLAPLSEVEQHIKADKHLPGIPSAQEVAEHGVSVGDMESKLLAKLEEVTLHLIAQEKAIQALQRENAELRKQMEARP